MAGHDLGGGWRRFWIVEEERRHGVVRMAWEEGHSDSIKVVGLQYATIQIRTRTTSDY